VEFSYLISIERKPTRRGDFGSKLTLNHPSSIDKKKKGPTATVNGGEKREKRFVSSFNRSLIDKFDLLKPQ